MQDDAQALIDKANSIVKKTGHGPGTRYPKKLKDIVSTLVNDYNFSVKQIITTIPVSQYSAREWPKRSQNQFKKITVKKAEDTPARKKVVVKKYTVEFQFIFLSLQALLLAFQIFLQ